MQQPFKLANPALKGRVGRALIASVLLAVGMLCWAAPELRAQETPIVRAEDGMWERSNGGKSVLASGSKLRIVTQGDVVIRGSDANQLTFQFHQKVRARDRDEAARRMGGLAVSVQTSGGTAILTVLPASALSVHTEVEVTVPRRLAELLVQNQLGGIEVVDIRVKVQAETMGGPIHMDRIQGNVVGRTGVGEISMGVITGTVRCSTGGGAISLERSGGDADCATAGGNISVGQVGGPLSVSTEGGNIQVETVNGPVRAHSVAGLIEVAQARGIVYADTQGGSIHVGQSEGVNAESAGGMIRLKQASGPLTVSTMMGNILAELMGGGGIRNSSLMTRDGDITVTIPKEMRLSVQAVTASGLSPRIISEFPEIHVKSVGFRSPMTGQGAINGGGPVLHLDATDGMIFLKKAK